jgi:hypothetical protein
MKRLEKLKQMVLSQDSHMKLTVGLAITILIFIIGGTWTAAIYFGSMKKDIKANEEDIKENQSDIETQANDNVVLKISVAEINTKLTYINKSQIEIIQLLTDD